MNLSAAIMLVRPDAVRPVRVEYDPDNVYKNNPTKVFKTVDPSIKKDDLVVVTTNTRQGFTVCKVIDVDFPVDYHSTEVWGWVAQKFDVEAFKKLTSIEAGVQHRVAKAHENKMRKEIVDAMGLDTVSFSDLQLTSLGANDPPAPPTPAPVAPVESPAVDPTTPPYNRQSRSEDPLF